MSYEQRFALAIFLTMIVFLVFTWLNPPVEPPPQTGGDAETISSATPEATTTPAPGRAGPTTAATPEAEVEGVEPDPQSQVAGPWAWLPADNPQPVTGEVMIDNGLYRVSLSKTGAIPVSWELSNYRQLFSDERYLRMVGEYGGPEESQKAKVAYRLLQETRAQDGDTPINAINPLYEPGNSGLIFRWGNNITDRRVRFETERDYVEVKEPADIVFRHENNGVVLEKVYTFYPESYQVDLQVRLINQTTEPLAFGDESFYDVTWQGGFGYPSLRSDAQNNLLMQRDGSVNIQLEDALRSQVMQSGAMLSYYPFPATIQRGESIGWVGVGQKYFMASIVPQTPTQVAIQGMSAPQTPYEYWQKPAAGVRLNLNAIPPGANRTDRFTLYVGPMDEEQLASVAAGLEDARQMFLKSFTGPIAQIALKVLQWLYAMVPNYGVCIIILTLIVKALMFPLYHKQLVSMKKMQVLSPHLNSLKEQYKNDPQKLQKEQMELFRKHKVNPLSGCLPILPTIPIFIALYATFSTMVELRGAEFFGWIHDLSEPDRAFYIPIGSYIFSVNILPLMYAVMMLISTSLQKMEGPNATAMKIVPLVFVFFFWNIAAGVILYFVISIMIDLTQRLILDRISNDQPVLETNTGKEKSSSGKEKKREAKKAK